MAVNAGTAYLDVEARLDKLEGEINKQSPGIFGRWGRSAGEHAGAGITSGIGKAVAAASVLAVGIGVGKFLGGAISEMQEAAKVGAQTNAVITSTGGAANVTAKQVESLSTSLSNMSGVDDEAIQAGENMLLTFTEVQNRAGKGNDIFNQASKSLLDMSVAMGTDAKSTAIQLGKALNDPIKGVTALQRVGVAFTDQQKDQIRAMVEAGNVAGAQKVILAELNKEFGGSAKAQATAADKLKVAWGNFQEQIGKGLAPALTVASNAGVKLLGVLTAAGGALASRLSPVVKEITGGLRAFGNAWRHFDDGVTSGFPGFMERVAIIAHKVFTELTGGFRAFFAAFRKGDGDITSSGFPGFMERVANVARDVLDRLQPLFRFMSDNARPILIGLGAAILTFVIPPLVAWVAAQIAAVAPILLVGAAVTAVVAGIIIAYQRFAAFRDIVQALAGVFSAAFAVISGVVQVAIAVITDLWSRFGGQLVAHIRVHLESLLQVFTGVLNIVRGVLDIFAGLFTGDWGRLWDGVKAIFVGIWDVIVGLLRGFVNAVSTIIGAAMAVISAVWGLAWHAVATLFSGVWDGILGAIGGAVGWIGDRVSDIVGFFLGLPGRILDAVGDLGSLLYEAGRKLISGFVDGIKSAFGWVKDTLGGLVGKLTSWKGPPPKDAVLLYGAGRLVIGGFVRGIEDSYDDVRTALGGVNAMVGGIRASGSASIAATTTSAASPGMALRQPPAFAGQPPSGLIDYDRLAAALAKALDGTALVYDRREVGRMVSDALGERARAR